jgi:hypothetical protein
MRQSLFKYPLQTKKSGPPLPSIAGKPSSENHMRHGTPFPLKELRNATTGLGRRYSMSGKGPLWSSEPGKDILKAPMLPCSEESMASRRLARVPVLGIGAYTSVLLADHRERRACTCSSRYPQASQQLPPSGHLWQISRSGPQVISRLHQASYHSCRQGNDAPDQQSAHGRVSATKYQYACFSASARD